MFKFLKKLFKKPMQILPNPRWLDLGQQYIGTTEIKGKDHNQTILGFWKSIKMGGIKNDEIAWCAAFVGAMLEMSGVRSTRSESARSYAQWGLELSGPCVGAIVVFWRDHPDSHFGHVGFVVGRDQKGNLMVLGGNQKDAVNIMPFALDRVVGYHWPPNVLAPKNPKFDDLPVIASDGKVSKNEA